MTYPLNSFMHQLITTREGFSSDMTIISDNAKLFTPTRKNRKSPKRSHSMPLVNRWGCSSLIGKTKTPSEELRPLTPDSRPSRAFTRWESSTRSEMQSSKKNSNSLTLPIRRKTSDKFSSDTDHPPKLVRNKSPELPNTSALPVSLRKLPY
jgi:hypothetical protein